MSSQTSDEAPENPDDDRLDHDYLEEVRQAAGSVVASLKWLLEATERVVDDPEAFTHVVAGGRSMVEAFVGGLTATPEPSGEGHDSDDQEQSSG